MKWWQIRLNPPQCQPSNYEATCEEAKGASVRKVLPKDKAEGSLAPYRFHVLAQLANILARITLYELLRLSKSRREALREALADAEAFMARIPAKPEEKDKENCLRASQYVPCITFTPDDMQVKGKHDRPLYFTGYIGSSEVSCIQVDPESALSIIPRRVMQHLGIFTHRLSATQTTIYGFNANGTRPTGKIKLKYQIRDLRSEVMCYVIDADT